jgi:hypothetical protein
MASLAGTVMLLLIAVLALPPIATAAQAAIGPLLLLLLFVGLASLKPPPRGRR